MDASSRVTGPGGARARLHAVETACSDAEHDLVTVLNQPLLFDPRHPVAARFRTDRAAARHQVEKDPHSWATQHTVADLETSWESLRSEARRVGLSGFSRWQRRRIRRGRQLLEQARSDRGSPRSRSAQYFRGLQLLSGLIDVPEPLRRAVHEAALHTEPLRIPGPDFPTHWHSPSRVQLRRVFSVVQGREAAALTTVTPEVRVRNRESSTSAAVRASSIAGDYHIAVGLQPVQADLTGRVMPIRLNVAVDDQPAGQPVYADADADASASPTPEGAEPAGLTTAALVLGGLALAGAGAVVGLVIARRRPQRG